MMPKKPARSPRFSIGLSASLLAALAFGAPPALGALATAQVDLIGPAGSGRFGTQVAALPNGNIVVVDPNDNPGGVGSAGAVYLYNGRTR